VALHEGRLFRNGGEAPSNGLATKPEAGRERIITVLGPCPSHSTNWPGRRRLSNSAKTLALLSERERTKAAFAIR